MFQCLELQMLAQNAIRTTEQPRDFQDSAKKPTPARVLVVDDERLVRWSIAETLMARGYSVAEACDARSAMQEIDAEDATDLVLLDLRLPDADDLRVLARIRQKAPGTPVILMTAFATREIVEEATALGASVVAKPFDLNDLAVDVERALAGRIY
jgi:two-component system, NtrC family, response regulator AtoC